jgi:hypothetical protein
MVPVLFIAATAVVCDTSVMAYRVVGTAQHSDGSWYDIVEADFAPTDQRLSGSKWRECALCGWTDRESAMSNVSGRWYCNKNGCSQEKSIVNNDKH